MNNEVNCVDKKFGVEHRSHRDGRFREPDRPDCTVFAEWGGAPREVLAKLGNIGFEGCVGR